MCCLLLNNNNKRRFLSSLLTKMTSLSVDQLRERRRQKILARSQAVHSIARYEGNTLLLVGRRGLVVLNRGLKLRPSPPVSADFISVPFSFIFIPTHPRRTSIPFPPVLAENSIHVTWPSSSSLLLLLL